MYSWPAPLTLVTTEKHRRAALLLRLLRVMILLAALGAVSAVFETQNDLRTTAVFYGFVFGVLLAVRWIVRSGHVIAAAWSMGVFYWLLIALVTVLFGGMQGQYASAFAVCVLLLGGIVGGRSALLMAIVSSLWCGFVVYLEVQNLLPTPLSPYSPINAWGTVTVTVLLTSVLLHESLASMQRMHLQAQQSAVERDEALRRSIQGQKTELVGNLTNGIAHDFNNLLSVVSAASALLRTRLRAEDSEEIEALDDLDDATNRAALLTRQLLSFGRSKFGEREAVNLSQVVRLLVKMLPRLFGTRILVKTDIRQDVWISASRVGIEQILLNLAVNARDAMPEGGEFIVNVDTEGDEVVLSVRDTGIGMTPEVLARVFEQFYTTKASGTGLGLATVKHHVDEVGGKITVASIPQAGTTFVCRFPVGEPGLMRDEDEEMTDEATTSAIHVRPRVIVVEDEPVVRRATSRLLRRAGYEVIALADGREALALCTESWDIVCVVTDFSMPRLDGAALAERLFELRPRLPVLIVSGNRRPHENLSHHPLRRYFSKPVDPELLLKTIEDLIASEARASSLARANDQSPPS